MVSANMTKRITNWHVLNDDFNSDHNYIEYKIVYTSPIPQMEVTSRNLRKIDQTKLEKGIIERTRGIDIGVTANDSAAALNRAFSEILNEVASKKEIITRRRSVNWLTPHIKQLWETSNQLLRVYTRKRKRRGGERSL